jgi:hypothetical protein
MEPVMALIDQASRIRLFNQALGVSVLDISPYPVDFIEAVITWAGELARKGML